MPPAVSVENMRNIALMFVKLQLLSLQQVMDLQGHKKWHESIGHMMRPISGV